MRIAVIGTGYVGLTQGAVLAEIGHTVVCVDTNKELVEALNRGVIHIYEPGLPDLVQRNTEAGRLRFTADSANAIKDAEVVFSAVGTPPDKDFRADLSAVRAVAELFGMHGAPGALFVNKSTVPVGTGRLCETIIADALQQRGVSHSYAVVSNPEFLREGTAVLDCLKPDRIVVGTDSESAIRVLEKLYQPIIEKGSVYFVTSRESAEIIKYASNALLATKISFMNEIAELAERVGADITEIERGVGLDNRIGRRFLHAGIGYGGSCFPKDIAALQQTGNDHDVQFKIISAVQAVNAKQREIFIEKLLTKMPDVAGKRIAVWGLSFKPKTNDMREAPAITIIAALLKRKADVVAYDPEATEEAKKIFPEIRYASSTLEAVEKADALLLITEWDEFRAVDFKEIKKRMRGVVVGDGRNIWQPKDVRDAGFDYFSIGRI